MAKFKIVNKQGQTCVRGKLGFSEQINSNEVFFFSQNLVRGFLCPNVEDAKKLLYTGFQGMPLMNFMSTLLNKDQYFMICAQVIEAYKTAVYNNLNPQNVCLDPNFLFINGQNGEMSFIYLAALNAQPVNNGFVTFLNQFGTSARFQTQEDWNAVSGFLNYLATLTNFSLTDIENYIANASPVTYSIVPRQTYAEGETNPAAAALAQPVNAYAQQPQQQNAYAQQNAYQQPQQNAYQPQQQYNNYQQPAAAPVQPAEPQLNVTGPYNYQPQNEEPKQAAYEPELQKELSDSQPEAQPAPKQEEVQPEAQPEAAPQPQPVQEAPAKEETPAPEQPEPAAPAQPAGPAILNNDDDEGTMLLMEDEEKEPPKLIRRSTGESFPVTKTVFTVGKERSRVDLCVTNNKTVSRVHATILLHGDECFVMDNNSTNRTFVNGTPIPVKTEIKLNNGDVVKFSNEEFDVVL